MFGTSDIQSLPKIPDKKLKASQKSKECTKIGDSENVGGQITKYLTGRQILKHFGNFHEDIYGNFKDYMEQWDIRYLERVKSDLRLRKSPPVNYPSITSSLLLNFLVLRNKVLSVFRLSCFHYEM